MINGRDTARHRQPVRLSVYRRSHDQHMAQLRAEDFVVADDLQWLPGDPDTVELVGHVYCRGKILIRVTKELEFLDDADDPLIQTRIYEYNAWVYRRGNILRYDNDHSLDEDAEPGTLGFHRHVFDWPPDRKNTRGHVEHVEDNAWPTLGDFIRMVADIYYDHAEELGSDPSDESMPGEP